MKLTFKVLIRVEMAGSKVVRTTRTEFAENARGRRERVHGRKERVFVLISVCVWSNQPNKQLNKA